jgi:hypothetical protein
MMILVQRDMQQCQLAEGGMVFGVDDITIVLHQKINTNL